MANELSTGTISTYNDSGAHDYSYKVKATQIASSQAGKIKFRLACTNKTVHSYEANWSNQPKRAYKIGKSKTFSESVSSVAVYPSQTAEIEIDQSWLDTTLYFAWGSMSYGTMASAAMLEAFDLSRTLTITIGSGVQAISAERSESNVDTDITAMSNGSIIYDDDRISYTAELKTGWQGSESGEFTVSADATTIAPSPTRKTYRLIVTVGEHAHVTVTRGSETLEPGAEIDFEDVLTVSMSADAGYSLSTQSIKNNGQAATSPVTVAGDVIIIAATAAMATINLYDGAGNVDKYLINVWTGSAWENFQAVTTDAQGQFTQPLA